MSETLDEWFERQEKIGKISITLLIQNLRTNLEAMTNLKLDKVDSIMRINKIMVRQCLKDLGVE